MNFILPLIYGFFAASLGILPPGMINMTAAKLSMQEGRVRALVFAGGASLIVILQTLISLFFAEIIDKNPSISLLLREVGFAIFLSLTIFFFIKGNKISPQKKHLEKHSKKSRFFLGMFLSAINVFPVPFYVFISVTLASYQYFSFSNAEIWSFVIGSGLGAFSAFYIYIAFFNKLEQKAAFFMKNMNYIIGSTTGIIAFFTLLRIINHYW
ncbi:lysine transporter LysE [Flavobacterium ardleyense]|uniref:lysine transporter LysE n=1 Tax=Flavobacterium ardleyense TaxID=2038737 RepID=UPI00298C746B|nr:lysine transporter LysE [Flavobacterium ardleyense]